MNKMVTVAYAQTNPLPLQEVYETTTVNIEFNQALIDKFTPMIHKLIKQQVYGYQSSDVCYEWQDLFQECLIHLHTATLQYDPSKGMKFENFVYLKFASRLGNFRNKISKHNFKTRNFSEIEGGWSITGSEVDSDRDSGFSSKMKGQVEYEQQDIMNEMIDAKIVLERLQGDRKEIYTSFYILGKSVKEICEENSHLKYYQVRRVLKYLEQIHTTLVEGNTCLN